MHACLNIYRDREERSSAYLWKAIARGEHRACTASILLSCSSENHRKQTNHVKQKRTNNTDRLRGTKTN